MAKDPQLVAAANNLTALAASPKRSNTSKIRDLLPQIEELKQGGFSNEQIRIALEEAGLEMSLKTFESILHRVRKRFASSGQMPQREQPTDIPPKDRAREASPPEEKPSNPRELTRLLQRSSKTADDSF